MFCFMLGASIPEIHPYLLRSVPARWSGSIAFATSSKNERATATDAEKIATSQQGNEGQINVATEDSGTDLGARPARCVLDSHSDRSITDTYYRRNATDAFGEQRAYPYADHAATSHQIDQSQINVGTDDPQTDLDGDADSARYALDDNFSLLYF